MTPLIRTRYIPRLKHKVGLQITATIRPDLSADPDERRVVMKLENLIAAGVSHFRLNLSHFTPDNPQARCGLAEEQYRARWRTLVQQIDLARERLGANVFIMVDTAGPTFRIHSATGGALAPGDQALLSCDGEGAEREEPTIRLNMPEGFESFGGDEVVGSEIAFKDGNFLALVRERLGPKLLRIEARQPFDLSSAQNVKANFPGFTLPGISAVSQRDLKDLEFFLTLPKAAPEGSSTAGARVAIHYVAQSFVRSSADITALVSGINGFGVVPPLIIPKIETAQAVEPQTLEAIIGHEDTAAVMVARGDLGIECSRWLVPSKQREIVRAAHSQLKPVLIATEVYGSMGVAAPGAGVPAWQPNRGEILDFRYALEAGIDGVVFSAETGARDDPETTVNYAIRQARFDEANIEELDLHRAERDRRRERLEYYCAKFLGRPTEMQYHAEPMPLRAHADFSTADWACAAVYRANTRRAIGIFPFTLTGEAVRAMVHFLPYRPIIAITDEEETLARLALYAHAYPVLVDRVSATFDVRDLKALVQEVMRKFELGAAGEEALATMPHPVRKTKGTDTLVLIRRL
jgi:pyruvate kinase